MGLGASQARFLMLTARKSDLEMQGQSINQARMALANKMSTMMDGQSQMNPDDPKMQQQQKQVEAIQQIDKRLEMQLRRVDTQQQAVQTEIQAVQKVIDKNIDMSFKTFA